MAMNFDGYRRCGDVDAGQPSLRDWMQVEANSMRWRVRKTANEVFIGEYSGELRLRVNPDENEMEFVRGVRGALQVSDVTITRTEVPNAATPGPNITYHALVVGFTEDEDGRPEPFQHRESFAHPMAAYNWVEETVPGFDLFPVTIISGKERALRRQSVGVEEFFA